MLLDKVRNSGWRGVGLVAFTYIYFLIFAQFAFLNRLAALGIAGEHLKPVMAAMAAVGILFSLLTPRVRLCLSPALRLRIGLGVSGAAAFLALLPLNENASIAVAMLIGAGLGLLTVTLVTHLRQWCGDRNQLLKIGLGTGLGYLACNVPPFFTASPKVQATTAGILGLVVKSSAHHPIKRKIAWRRSLNRHSLFHFLSPSLVLLPWSGWIPRHFSSFRTPLC